MHSNLKWPYYKEIDMYVAQIDPIFFFSAPLAVRRRLPRSLSETRAWTLTPPCQPLNQTRRGPSRKGVSLWKTANRSGNATPPAANSYAPSTTGLAIFTQTVTQGRAPLIFFLLWCGTCFAFHWAHILPRLRQWGKRIKSSCRGSTGLPLSSSFLNTSI